MGNPVVQGRVPPDVEERVENWRKAEGIETQSDAVRRLVIFALDQRQSKEQDIEEEQPKTESYWVNTLSTIGGALGAATIVAFVLWVTGFAPELLTSTFTLAVVTIVTNGLAYHRLEVA